MSKVLLTREQAEAIEHGLTAESSICKGSPSNLINLYSHNKYSFDGFSGRLRPINDLTVSKLAKALYIGYEVEETFEVGDWVVRTKELGHQNFYEGKIFKVKRIDKGHLTGQRVVVDNDDNSEHVFENIRHATPEEIAEEKQRRWWGENGRDVWELKQGDVVMGKHREIHEVTADPKSHRYGCYTMDDSFDVDKNELIEEFYWSVICFRDERKDVDHE